MYENLISELCVHMSILMFIWVCSKHTTPCSMHHYGWCYTPPWCKHTSPCSMHHCGWCYTPPWCKHTAPAACITVADVIHHPGANTQHPAACITMADVIHHPGANTQHPAACITMADVIHHPGANTQHTCEASLWLMHHPGEHVTLCALQLTMARRNLTVEDVNYCKKPVVLLSLSLNLLNHNPTDTTNCMCIVPRSHDTYCVHGLCTNLSHCTVDYSHKLCKPGDYNLDFPRFLRSYNSRAWR